MESPEAKHADAKCSDTSMGDGQQHVHEIFGPRAVVVATVGLPGCGKSAISKKAKKALEIDPRYNTHVRIFNAGQTRRKELEGCRNI